MPHWAGAWAFGRPWLVQRLPRHDRYLDNDLYTEITCPWCLVGQFRLDKVLAGRFPHLAVEIHHHPVLLLAGVPAAGLYIPDLLRSHHGVTDPKVAFARPEGEARASELKLDLSRQLWAYATQPAHALIIAAREHGTQHRLAVAISEGYFLGAMNIGDADVLAGIAADYGFESAEAHAIALDPIQHKRVEQEAVRSAAAGVRSVPHFIFGGRAAINGGRSEDEIALHIQEAARAQVNQHR